MMQLKNNDSAVHSTELVNELKGLLDTSTEILELHYDTRRGSVVLNLDLDVVYEYIWPNDTASKKLTVSLNAEEARVNKITQIRKKQLCNILISQHKPKFGASLKFTHASFFELLYSFHKKANIAAQVKSEKGYDKFMRGFGWKKQNSSTDFTATGNEQKLKEYLSEHNPEHVQEAAGRALSLFGSDSVIRPYSRMDDRIARERHLPLYDDYIEKMIAIRQKKDFHGNSEELEFHFKVDAINLIYAHAQNRISNVASRLVTETNYHHRRYARESVRAKLPFMWLAVDQLCNMEKDKYGDFLSFMTTLVNYSKLHLETAIQHKSQIPSITEENIRSFYESFVHPITDLYAVEDDAFLGEERDESLPSDHKSFLAYFNDTTESARQSIKSLVGENEYLIDFDENLFGFENDPLVMGMKNENGI